MTKLLQKINIVALGGTALIATLAMTGCGGTMAFQGDKAFSVTGSQPAPPPPPPPAEPAATPAPAPAPSHVNVQEGKLVIDEKIQFEHDKAVILAVSHGILNEVVKAMTDNPDILRVLIEGHASSEGDAKRNLSLSEERAKAVLEYLVSHGVDKKRLTSRGFGSTQPIADNATEPGREKNRRVEFTITSRKSARTGAK